MSPQQEVTLASFAAQRDILTADNSSLSGKKLTLTNEVNELYATKEVVKREQEIERENHIKELINIEKQIEEKRAVLADLHMACEIVYNSSQSLNIANQNILQMTTTLSEKIVDIANVSKSVELAEMSVNDVSVKLNNKIEGFVEAVETASKTLTESVPKALSAIRKEEIIQSKQREKLSIDTTSIKQREIALLAAVSRQTNNQENK